MTLLYLELFFFFFFPSQHLKIHFIIFSDYIISIMWIYHYLSTDISLLKNILIIIIILKNVLSISLLGLLAKVMCKMPEVLYHLNDKYILKKKILRVLSIITHTHTHTCTRGKTESITRGSFYLRTDRPWHILGISGRSLADTLV